MQSQPATPTVIFVDGACSGNPGPGGWGAVLLLPDKTILELGGGGPNTTNNQMELMAAIQALIKTGRASDPVRIFCDSKYVLNGIQKWIHGWKARGWLTAEGKPVANQELWQRLWEVSRNQTIQWCYVPGHSGIAGNERADQIAVSYSQGNPGTLFHGKVENYPYPIFPLPSPDGSASQMNSKKSSIKTGSQKKPYSYLSLVGQVPMRHASWKECEARVNGESSARFRKTLNEVDETEILAGWGFKPGDLKKISG